MIEGLLVLVSPLVESLCCVLEQHTLSSAYSTGLIQEDLS